jgi:FMN phosphatase YigB (HAD superfamily)
MTPRLTFFLDVDNTLLDNDAAKAEMDRQLACLLGEEGAAEFWQTYEAIRAEETIVDIPSTIARYMESRRDAILRFALAELFMTFDFARFVYPDAFAALKHLQTFGTTAILSDGDPVYQTAKIHRSGLADAVGGNTIVYLHKETHLTEITAAYPADHFFFIDDKPAVLEKIAQSRRKHVSTVFIRQGKYALTPHPHFTPDLSLASLADLLTITTWPPA